MSWKRPDPKSRMRPLLSIIPEPSSHFGLYIDVGSGDGLFAEMIEEKYSQSMVIRADIYFYNIRNEFLKADIRALPFRKKSFNGIVIAQVLHYLPYSNHNPIINRTLELLESGGWVLIIEYEEKRSYNWLPFPIDADHLNLIFESLTGNFNKQMKRIQDGRRPKFSFLISKH